MVVTVHDILQLPILQNCFILTGDAGLQNTVKQIGILDYEYTENMQNIFQPQELVISSCLFAKNNEALLFAAIRQLIENHISALGIKTIFFHQLSQDIISFAQEHHFCLFLFPTSLFFEDIITQASQLLHLEQNNQKMEKMVKELLSPQKQLEQQREIALSINPAFEEYSFAIYYQPKEESISLADLQNKWTMKPMPNNAVILYEKGLLLLLTAPVPFSTNPVQIQHHYQQILQIENTNYFIGISKINKGLPAIAQSIQQALFTTELAKKQGQSPLSFAQTGLYQLLLPTPTYEGLQQFSYITLQPLYEYDKKYKSDLFPTIICYIDNHYHIKKTAQSLYQHENTIRYRIHKAKELLNIDNNNQYFEEQLLIAVKIYQLYPFSLE